MSKQQPVGYMVFWWSTDDIYGLNQALRVEEKTPEHGILMCANKGEPLTMFETRADAKEAIRQHHHFMQCHYSRDSDDSKRMTIVPVFMSPELPKDHPNA